jgi:hypothetical protein
MIKSKKAHFLILRIALELVYTLYKFNNYGISQTVYLS